MFYISISNGLLKDGHRKRMGSAVWEFMWMLDKVTRVDEDGTGWVLGGKTINLKMIASDLGTHTHTVSENIIKLDNEGYIEKISVHDGLVLKVKKARKKFGRKVESDGTSRPEKTEPPSGKDGTFNKVLDIAFDKHLSLTTKIERETCAQDLKRLFPALVSIPPAIPPDRVYLFWHKVRCGEIRRSEIMSPVAYMAKMLDEDITPRLIQDRERKARAQVGG